MLGSDTQHPALVARIENIHHYRNDAETLIRGGVGFGMQAAMTGWLKLCRHFSSDKTLSATFSSHIISHHHLSLLKKKQSSVACVATYKLVTFQIKQQQQHINHSGRQWDAA